jgi:uncharacterized protein
MKKNKISFIILCIIVLLTSNVYGISYKLPEPSYSFYVYDETNIIDSNLENYIVETNKMLYKKTGAQVVVAAVDSLEDMDINSYATKLFEKWKIGSREYDNGILVLIVPNDREIWIEVGYGLEGALPDSKMGRIINDLIIPYFSDGEFSKGILAGFNEILNNIEKEYDVNLNRDKIDEDLYDFGDTRGQFSVFNSFGKIMLVLGIIIFLFIDFRFFNGWITYSLLRGSGGSGHRGNSSRGSGRSSGGGGRSGGGGAGGKW